MILRFRIAFLGLSVLTQKKVVRKNVRSQQSNRVMGLCLVKVVHTVQSHYKELEIAQVVIINAQRAVKVLLAPLVQINITFIQDTMIT